MIKLMDSLAQDYLKKHQPDEESSIMDKAEDWTT